MDKEYIKTCVEEYLGSRRESIEINYDDYDNSYERFLLHTVKRLQMTYDLLRKQECESGDFLLALRDYLLTYQTEVTVSWPDSYMT